MFIDYSSHLKCLIRQKACMKTFFKADIYNILSCQGEPTNPSHEQAFLRNPSEWEPSTWIIISSDSAGIQPKLTSPIPWKGLSGTVVEHCICTCLWVERTSAVGCQNFSFPIWNRLEPSWNRRGTVLRITFCAMEPFGTVVETSRNRVFCFVFRHARRLHTALIRMLLKSLVDRKKLHCGLKF